MLQEIIVLTAAYIVLVGLFQPRRNKATATDPTTPVDYFPEVEATPEPQAKATLASLIKEEAAKQAIAATALSPVAPVVTAQPQPVEVFTMPTTDLSRLGVRDLYKLASKAGIKGYKKLSKGALIQALA